MLRLSEVRTRIDSVAQDWYGVPYKWGGSSKQGVDCSALVQHLYKDAFAYKLPRVTETQVQAGRRVSREQVRPGDLVFFRPEGEYNHVGVYLGQDTFVHASSSEGVTRAPFDKDYWAQYYWTARRPLTPATVPNRLASELVAYRRPGSSAQEGETSSSDDAEGAAALGDVTLASCEDASVRCADPSEGSGGRASAPADTTRRKGW